MSRLSRRTSPAPQSPAAIESLESRQFLSASQLPSNTSHDRRWINLTASSDLLEISLGNLAQTNGSAQIVKDFGARMSQDHTASLQVLHQVAADLGVTATNSLNAENARTVRLFSRLHGTAFDSAYSSFMVGDHQDDINSFRVEARLAGSTLLSSFARSGVGMLQTHLTLAEQADQAVNGTTAAG